MSQPSFTPKQNSIWKNNKAPTISTIKTSIKRITPIEMAVMREKGLCYNCDEPFISGHKCIKQQLFMVVAEED